MYKRWKIILFISLFFLINSCKKDEDEVSGIPNYSYQEMRDYCFFLPGTYWVYRDTLSGLEDSVYVYEANEGSDTVINNNVTKIYKYFVVKTYSTFYNYTYEFNSNESSAVMWNVVPVWRDKYKPGDVDGSTFLAVFPLKLNQFYGPFTQDGVVTYTKFFQNLVISGVPLVNIIKINDTKNSTEGNSRTNFYLSKNFGIIRKEILDSSRVWDVMQYHILQ